MTELSRTLIGRGLLQSLSRSSLRTQGPITPGLKSEKRPLLECRSESPRRMGPRVRRDDLLRSTYRSIQSHAIALPASGRGEKDPKSILQKFTGPVERTKFHPGLRQGVVGAF